MSMKTIILPSSHDCSNTDTALFVALVDVMAVAQSGGGQERSNTGERNGWST